MKVTRTKSWTIGTGIAGVLIMISACSSDNVATPQSVPPIETTANSTPLSVADTVPATTPDPDPVPITTPATTAETIAPDSIVARTPVKVLTPVAAGAGQATVSRRDLAADGYSETEFFIEGSATSYAPDGKLSADGLWAVTADASADYRTRIVVRRPADAADFSGTVLVEWLNVSSGADGDPDWGYTSDELIRSGHAWVGVSAQAVGVNGGGSILGEQSATPGGLVNTDSVRYGTLVHPGDAFSYDIFTQAATALTAHDGPAPLGDLVPTQIIASGESQSAFFMTTYINAVHPLAQLFQGFLVHSRAAGGSSLDGSPNTDIRGAAGATAIRSDLDTPVMVFQTETDLTVLGYGLANQDDANMVRVWQVAGTAHADEFLLVEVYGLGADTDLSTLVNCAAPLNAGPHHEVLQAALHHLIAWVSNGTEPPASPRLELAQKDPPTLARDEHGIVLGGIRTPLVDVPVDVLSGDLIPGSVGFCALFGSTLPLDPAVLATMYPSAQEYLDAFAGSLQATVDAGFVLEVDAGRLLAESKANAALIAG